MHIIPSNLSLPQCSQCMYGQEKAQCIDPLMAVLSIHSVYLNKLIP